MYPHEVMKFTSMSTCPHPGMKHSMSMKHDQKSKVVMLCDKVMCDKVMCDKGTSLCLMPSQNLPPASCAALPPGRRSVPLRRTRGQGSSGGPSRPGARKGRRPQRRNGAGALTPRGRHHPCPTLCQITRVPRSSGTRRSLGPTTPLGPRPSSRRAPWWVPLCGALLSRECVPSLVSLSLRVGPLMGVLSKGGCLCGVTLTASL